MSNNIQIRLASTPESYPEAHHFNVLEEPIPKLDDGQVLCQTFYLSLDPYMRNQIAGRYLNNNIKPGDLMLGETISRVVESRNPEFAVGELVRCFGNWQQYSVHDASQLQKQSQQAFSPSYELSILGMPGLTAYAGLMWLVNLKAGATIVIPAATGAVGSTAGQLAKIHGCKVIGIAGSDEKCRYAVEKLGYDSCINRKTENLDARLDELCPNGIDVYFDLVGGHILNLVCTKLAIGAQIILCGLMADYNSQTRTPGPLPGAFIGARAIVYGLVVYDFEHRRDEFIEACLPYLNDGRLSIREDISEGIESAPESFCRLMRGANEGKALVKVF